MLILSGGGDDVQAESHHRLFWEMLDHKRPLLHVPGGGFPVEDADQFLNRALSRYGNTEITTWVAWEAESPPDLAQYGGIYVGGGNTFALLHYFRLKHFDKMLKRAVESGTAYFGGSAGAVLMGVDLLSCEMMDVNEVNLTPTTGLDLVSGAALWCHYKPSDHGNVLSLMKKYSHISKIIALTEESCLKINPHREICVGDGDAVHFFCGAKSVIFHPGEIVHFTE
jgi:dipeptidase E